VIERGETSAVRPTERLISRRGVARTEAFEKVAGKSGSLEAGRRLMVVHDVEGPIVTGVLGGD
jgi:hypothetical protein